MSTQQKGYYDVEADIVLDEVDGARLAEVMYLKDLKQRKLFLNDEVSSVSAIEVVHHILQFNAEDKGIPIEQRKPILLYVTSIGGSVDAGYALIDTILCSKTPVYTVNLGWQYSMGFLIGLAGSKRFAVPNARFLMHDGSSFVYDSGAKAQDQMEFQKRVEERTRSYVLSRSCLTPEEYDAKFRVEWYLFADEAKRYGFTDFIIGLDCAMDEVV